MFVAVRACSTRYPPELIKRILGVKGIGYLCDEIEREERPGYLQHVLWWTVRGHLTEQELSGRRILDFGCGSGASTMILARLFADAEFVGVDIDEPALGIAEARRRHYGLSNVEFRRSPSELELPPDLGEFDVVVFSAVFEHLLPAERPIVIPKLWSVLRPGGLVLVGETPHRFTPIETHTTGGLPLINYLPAPLTLRIAKRFSPRLWADATWEQLLRAGIRGGSEGQFLAILRKAGFDDAVLRRPSAHHSVRDEFDLWYEISHVNELPGLKSQLRSAFRFLKRTTGVSFTPYLSFAVEKTGSPAQP
jgi:2-polyprenyl-3-methyl-5-hydroxy-6-metoxy-1,4-benzoquinol methylase